MRVLLVEHAPAWVPPGGSPLAKPPHSPVTSGYAIVSLAYLAVPVVHLLLSNRALFAFLCGIYFACVATVLVCAVLYATRLTFVGRFDAEAKHWLPICGSYLAASASPPPSPPPLPSPPASMEAVV